MKKKRSYSDSVHFYGIIWDIAALLVFMMIPVSICLHLNVWPEAKYIFKGLLPVAMIFYPSAVIEVLTYTPLLGAGGTYLGFVTGNITNLKLPCGLNAQRLAEASRAGNKRHLCFFVQNFRNQTRFVNIIKSTIPNFLEIRNTDRDTQFLHLCCSFRVAMHRFLIASMIP